MALFTDDARIDANLAEVLRDAARAPNRSQTLAGLGPFALGVRNAQVTRYVVADLDDGSVTTSDVPGDAEATMTMEAYLVHELLAGHVSVLTTLARGQASITGATPAAMRLLSALPALSQVYQDHLEPDGLPEPIRFGTVEPARLPEGLPSSLRASGEDQMLLVAIALSTLGPIDRSVQNATLFAAFDTEELTDRHLARLLTSLADLAAGNSGHGRARHEQEAERNAQEVASVLLEREPGPTDNN
jgi:hypothetical protein